MKDRYQDYVIKDGRFIGRFEEMYQEFDDPWHQKEALAHSYARWDTVLTLKNLNVESFLEVGCGLGQFSNFIVQHIPSIQQKGIDISDTAIKKARASYPNLSFEVGNVEDIFETKNYLQTAKDGAPFLSANLGGGMR